jgi:DNA-binding transcriptional ArsR family regulator
VELLRVLAEPRRRHILRLVWNVERSAGDIARAFDVTFGAVSQHLKVLQRAGVVQVRRAGRYRLYRADRAALGPLGRQLVTMWEGNLGALKRAAESEEKRGGRRGRR